MHKGQNPEEAPAFSYTCPQVLFPLLPPSCGHPHLRPGRVTSPTTIGREPGGPYICLRGLPPPAPWPGRAAFHSSMVCSVQPRVRPTYTSGSGSLYRASAPLVIFRRSATSVRLRYLRVTVCVLLPVRTRRRPARRPLPGSAARKRERGCRRRAPVRSIRMC